MARRRPLVRGSPPPLRPRVGPDRHRPGDGPATRAAANRSPWHESQRGTTTSGRSSRCARRSPRCSRSRPSPARSPGCSGAQRRSGSARPQAATLLARLVLAPLGPRARVAGRRPPRTSRRRRAAGRAARVTDRGRRGQRRWRGSRCGGSGTRRRGKRAAKWATRSDLAELRVRRPERGRITLGHHRGALIAAEERASVMVVGPTQSGKTHRARRARDERMGRPRPLDLGQIRRPRPDARGALGARRGTGLRPDRRSPRSGTPCGRRSAASTSWTGARRTAAALLGVGDHSTGRSADDAFWRPAGARYLAALLLRRHQEPGPHDGRRPALDRDLRVRRADQAPRQHDQRPARRPAIDAIQSVKGADHRFVSSLLQTIATALDAWQEPQVAGATMGESRISADWLLDGANTLYIVAPANDQRRLSGLFAALVAHIVAGAYERSAQDRPPDRPRAAARARRGLQHRAAPEPRRDRLDRPRAGRAPALRAAEHLPGLRPLGTRPRRDDHRQPPRPPVLLRHRRPRHPRLPPRHARRRGDRPDLHPAARHRHPGRADPTAREHRPLAAPHRVRQADRIHSLLVYGRLAPAWITLRARRDATGRQPTVPARRNGRADDRSDRRTDHESSSPTRDERP